MSEIGSGVQKKPKKIKKKRKWLKKLIAWLVVLALLSGAFYLFVLPQLKASATTTYNSYEAVTGTISNSMSFSGSVSVKNYETLTSGAEGTVRRIYVTEDQQVSTGDKLMRLSSGETIKAGFDGRVNEISVEEGDTVAANTSLIQVVDFSNMKVSLRVDEYDISNVYVGQECKVTVKALDLTFDSKLSHINRISASNGSTAYYTVTADVEVSENVLPGMQVTVTIPQEEAVDAVILNKDALSFDQKNSAYVLTKDDSDEMVETYVETGVDNDNYVEIKSGLSAGDTVYAKVETRAESNSGLAGLFSLLGGGTTDTSQQSGQMPGGGQMPSDFGGGNFGSGSFGGGGNRPSNMGGGMP